MWLLRERLRDFIVKQILYGVDSLICTPKNSLRSHLRAIMALDHSRLSVENKSGRIFCVRQVYFKKSCQQIWVRANQPFTLFIHHIWGRKSTMSRCFYHTDLVQNAVVHNFSRQIAFIHFRTIKARVDF